MNQTPLIGLRQTVVVVPLSTAAAAHPSVTVSVQCRGKRAVAVIDQVRAVSRERLVSKIETASGEDVLAVGEDGTLKGRRPKCRK